MNLHIYQEAGASLDADRLRNIASNIILGDSVTNLKDYVYSFLDETNLFHIEIIPQSGAEISFEYDQSAPGNGFSNIKYGDMFSYDIEYTIEDVAYPGVIPPAVGVNSVNTLDVKFEVTPVPPQVSQKFTKLTPGQFYNIYANVTNRLTNTLTKNILVAENIPTIPPIEIVNLVIIDEYTVRIIFTPHDINTVPQTVGFKAGINDIEVYQNTSLRQNLNTSIPSTDFQYDYNFNNAPTSYGESYLRDDIDTSIQIVNDPYEMIQSAKLHSSEVINTFDNPNPPRTPYTISYSEGGVYNFNWNFPDGSGKKETKYKYKLYHNDGLVYTSSYGSGNTNTSVTSTSITEVTISNPINIGKWDVESVNLYDSVSSSRLSITVTQPTFTLSTFVFYETARVFKVDYTIIGANYEYDLTDSSSDLTLVDNRIHNHLTVTLLNSDRDSETIIINFVDALNFSLTQAVTLMQIVLPTISIDNLQYNRLPRIYTLDVTTTYQVSPLNITSKDNITLTNCTLISYSTNLITIQVDDTDSSINVSGNNFKVIDHWGFISNPATFSDNIIPTFASLTISLSYVSERTFKCDNDNLDYEWTYGISGAQTLQQITIPDIKDNFGDISCTITQKNSYGFTKTYTDTINDNDEPTTSDFVGLILNTNTYTYSLTILNSDITFVVDSEVLKRDDVVLSYGNSYTQSGLYELYGIFKNKYGFTKRLLIVEHRIYIAPTGTFSLSSTSTYTATVDTHDYLSLITTNPYNVKNSSQTIVTTFNKGEQYTLYATFQKEDGSFVEYEIGTDTLPLPPPPSLYDYRFTYPSDTQLNFKFNFPSYAHDTIESYRLYYSTNPISGENYDDISSSIDYINNSYGLRKYVDYDSFWITSVGFSWNLRSLTNQIRKIFRNEEDYFGFMYDRIMRVGSRRTQDEFFHDRYSNDWLPRVTSHDTPPSYPHLIPNTRYYFKFVIKWTKQGYSCTNVDRLFYRDPQNSTFIYYSWDTQHFFDSLLPSGTPHNPTSPPMTLITPPNPTYTLTKKNNKYYFETLNLGDTNIYEYEDFYYHNRFVCLFYTTSKTSNSLFDSEIYWFNLIKSNYNWINLKSYPNNLWKVENSLYCSSRLSDQNVYFDRFESGRFIFEPDELFIVSDQESDAVIDGDGKFSEGTTLYTKLAVYYMAKQGAPFRDWWSVEPRWGPNHYCIMFTVSNDWVEITV